MARGDAYNRPKCRTASSLVARDVNINTAGCHLLIGVGGGATDNAPATGPTAHRCDLNIYREGAA